jgi:hypothetical protein
MVSWSSGMKASVEFQAGQSSQALDAMTATTTATDALVDISIESVNSFVSLA